jgi:hypothetical protein
LYILFIAIEKCPAVPIPNTEVKPTGADDTASFRCGKVGSRRIKFKQKARSEMSGLFTFVIIPNKMRGQF